VANYHTYESGGLATWLVQHRVMESARTLNWGKAFSTAWLPFTVSPGFSAVCQFQLHFAGAGSRRLVPSCVHLNATWYKAVFTAPTKLPCVCVFIFDQHSLRGTAICRMDTRRGHSPLEFGIKALRPLAFRSGSWKPFLNAHWGFIQGGLACESTLSESPDPRRHVGRLFRWAGGCLENGFEVSDSGGNNTPLNT